VPDQGPDSAEPARSAQLEPQVAGAVDLALGAGAHQLVQADPGRASGVHPAPVGVEQERQQHLERAGFP
jgi:hypothetical protein